MELCLLRHGLAEERDPHRWPDDALRPLTKEGREVAKRVGNGLASFWPRADRIVSSPAIRALRTAELLRPCWPRAPEIRRWAEAAPGRAAAPLLTRLGTLGARVHRTLLIGHEPTLGALAALALFGEEVPVVRLSRNGALLLEFPRRVAPGAARLTWLLTRKQLLGLAP